MVAGAASTHTHRNHRDTETQRAHRAHRNLTADHADRRRWIQASLKQVASRPLSDNGRRPEDRATTPNASIRRRFPVLRPALEASAGLATPHPLIVDGLRLPFKNEEGRGGTDAPEARRPVGSTATTDACVRRCRAAHRERRSSDRRLFRRKSRHCNIKEPICVYLRDLRANCDGWSAFVSSCLRCPL